MNNLLFLIAVLFTTTLSLAQVHVKGYYRSNGTYVQPYQRTAPNYTRNDNYSTVGNTNPHTGKAGTHPRDGYTSTKTYYPSSRTISTTTTPRSYSSSSYSTRTYSTPTYSTPTYSAPTYSAPTYSASTYSTPTYQNISTPRYSTSNTYSTPSYSSSNTVYTGSRGGQYYINSNGNKSYISK